MELIKTNEKIILFMFRHGYTQQDIAKRLGITRQYLSTKLKDNIFGINDIQKLKTLGFKA